jgi:hypothetical protein
MSAASSEAARRHTAVVIPALDEATNIEEVYERLRRAVLALPDTQIGVHLGGGGNRRLGEDLEATLAAGWRAHLHHHRAW